MVSFAIFMDASSLEDCVSDVESENALEAEASGCRPAR